MEENVTRINYQDKELILIGTAHVSEESVQLVKEVIDREQPDSICVELDAGRYENMQNPKEWEETDIIQIIKKKKVGFMLANLILSSYQKKMAGELGTTVGQEMMQGIESAKALNAELVLADRSIQATFLRIWRGMSFFRKMKLIFSFMFSMDEDQEVTNDDLNEMLKGETLETMLAEMRKEFPEIGRVLIDERDQHLANKIKAAKGPKVVAILGAAHVPGIKEEIFKEQDMEAITQIPKPGIMPKVISFLIPVLVIAIIGYGFFNNFSTGMQQLSAWVLWNSLLAAIFTLIAWGHPLSILTSLIIAPISSLNPFLACGWFTGIVEATIRKPKVADFNKVPEDIFSVKGFFKNRLLRILLVVILANLGSTIGTFIAGAEIIRHLF